MGEQVLTVALGAAAALFGGLNIFQLLFLRSTRRKYVAEAAREETGARRGQLDLMQDQIAYLMKKYSDMHGDYCALAESYRALQARYSEETTRMDREIRKLRDEIEALRRENEALRGRLGE